MNVIYKLIITWFDSCLVEFINTCMYEFVQLRMSNSVYLQQYYITTQFNQSNLSIMYTF